jgi:hypothetical protein
MEFKKIILAAFSVMLLSSCGNSNNKQEMKFYKQSKAADLYRIPLIQPYELISADRGASWHYKTANDQIGNVDAVGINNTIVVIHSPSVYRPDLGGNVEQWHIINASDGTEMDLTTESDYEAYKKKLNLYQIKLYNVNDLFREFDNKGTLPLEWKALRN